MVDGSEDPPSEEDSSDELKESLNSSFKILGALQEGILRRSRKDSSITSLPAEKVNKAVPEFEILEDDTEHLSDNDQRIEGYQRTINQLER